MSAVSAIVKGKGFRSVVAQEILDVLEAARYAVVKLPRAEADWHGGMTLWPAPLTNSHYPGQIVIRKSDGRIGMTSVPSQFDNADDARSVAVSLLAAADAWEAAQ